MEATKGSGTLTIKGSSAGLSVDLTSADAAISGFTSIVMETEGDSDTVELTSDQIGSGSGKYSSFRGTLTSNTVDDKVVVSAKAGGESATSLDLTDVTSLNVVFDVTDFDELTTLKLGSGNSVAMTTSGFAALETLSGDNTNTLELTGAYAELASKAANTAVTLSIVDETDTTSNTVVKATIKGGVTVEDGLFVFGGTSSQSADFSGSTADLKGEYDGSGTVGIIGGSGDDHFGFYSNAAVNASKLVGGNGADLLQGGKLMFAGDETTATDGVYASSSDTTEGGSNSYSEEIFFSKDDVGSEDYHAFKGGYNILIPFGVNESHMVLAGGSDVVYLFSQHWTGKDGSATANSRDAGKSYTVDNFNSGSDLILIHNADSQHIAEGISGGKGASSCDLKASDFADVLSWKGSTTSGTLTIDWTGFEDGKIASVSLESVEETTLTFNNLEVALSGTPTASDLATYFFDVTNENAG